MSKNKFFDETSEQSLRKIQIVEEYFKSWSQIISSTVMKGSGDKKIGYIDLFAGRGRYGDGVESTPLRILQIAVRDEKLRSMLITIFNDIDPNNSQAIAEEIFSLPDIDKLTHEPRILTQEVNDDIIPLLNTYRKFPTLFFLDPWGYKGISLNLIGWIIREWGCDCIFFFNYNRINMGLDNPFVEEHMEALFGDRTSILREKLQVAKTPAKREDTILEELVQALKDKAEGSNRYVLHFRFKREVGGRTSHHLIFLTKHLKGYEVMKEIMGNASSFSGDDIPSFEYNPAADISRQLQLFPDRIAELKTSLLQKFTGRRITMATIYETHTIGTPYVKRNYRRALNELEREGLITAEPPINHRRKLKGEVSFPDHVLVIFP